MPARPLYCFGLKHCIALHLLKKENVFVHHVTGFLMPTHILYLPPVRLINLVVGYTLWTGPLLESRLAQALRSLLDEAFVLFWAS